MTSTKLAAFTLTFALAMSSSAAFGQGTMEQRIACTPDVFRLCKGEIPNVSKIVDCMEKQKESLSPACKAVFNPDLLNSTKSAQSSEAKK